MPTHQYISYFYVKKKSTLSSLSWCFLSLVSVSGIINVAERICAIPALDLFYLDEQLVLE